MNTKETKQENMILVPESVPLSLVASKLNGRDLFPERTAYAKKYMKNAKINRP